MTGIRLINKQNFYSTDNYKPEKIYPNSDLAKIQILSDNKNKSGVYLWRNLLNGKEYIGSSSDLRIRLRNYFKISHLERQYSMLINRALLKYGYSNFSLEILEYCEPSVVVEREQYYMDLFQPEYNLLPKAGSRLGHKHSEETIEKLRNHWKGREHSKETLEKLSALQTGRVLSEETRAKMSASAKLNVSTGGVRGTHPKSQKVEVLDLESNCKTTYISARKAAKALSCSPNTISVHLKSISPNPYKGRYIFTPA